MKKIGFLIYILLMGLNAIFAQNTPNKAIIGFYNLENLFETRLKTTSSSCLKAITNGPRNAICTNWTVCHK